jgi:dihydroxyacetone kinase-like predicted kinase
MKRINGKFFVAAFQKAAERLLANKDEINALNVFPVQTEILDLIWRPL